MYTNMQTMIISFDFPQVLDQLEIQQRGKQKKPKVYANSFKMGLFLCSTLKGKYALTTYFTLSEQNSALGNGLQGRLKITAVISYHHSHGKL